MDKKISAQYFCVNQVMREFSNVCSALFNCIVFWMQLIILLVIGAGGVFKQVLVDSGVGPALGEALTGMGLPIAITCFVLAAAVRIIQGSATVACLTAVGLVMPVIEQLNFSGAQMAALSICIAGGSIVVSHVNDAGFWLFGKFTGATEAQTLKTWTMMETILGTVGAIIGMIAFQLLS